PAPADLRDFRMEQLEIDLTTSDRLPLRPQSRLEVDRQHLPATHNNNVRPAVRLHPAKRGPHQNCAKPASSPVRGYSKQSDFVQAIVDFEGTVCPVNVLVEGI